MNSACSERPRPAPPPGSDLEASLRPPCQIVPQTYSPPFLTWSEPQRETAKSAVHLLKLRHIESDSLKPPGGSTLVSPPGTRTLPFSNKQFPAYSSAEFRRISS